jgi:hypothetical protein
MIRTPDSLRRPNLDKWIIANAFSFGSGFPNMMMRGSGFILTAIKRCS